RQEETNPQHIAMKKRQQDRKKGRPHRLQNKSATLHLLQQVFLCEHRPLLAASRAGGIKQNPQVTLAKQGLMHLPLPSASRSLFLQKSVDFFHRQQLQTRPACLQRLGSPSQFRISNQHIYPRIIQDIDYLIRFEEIVDRNGGSASVENREQS